MIDGWGKERGDPLWSGVICLTHSFSGRSVGGQFGLFSPTPMNGCRQGISDACDKVSHPRCPSPRAPARPPAFQVTTLAIPPRAATERQSKVVSCRNAQM